jgi:hypothetical protein
VEQDTRHLSGLFQEINDLVAQQGENIECIEEQVVHAKDTADDAGSSLSKSSKQQTYSLGLAGGITGAIIGGPIGFVIGAKTAVALSLTGGLVGVVAAKRLERSLATSNTETYISMHNRQLEEEAKLRSSLLAKDDSCSHIENSDMNDDNCFQKSNTNSLSLIPKSYSPKEKRPVRVHTSIQSSPTSYTHPTMEGNKYLDTSNANTSVDTILSNQGAVGISSSFVPLPVAQPIQVRNMSVIAPNRNHHTAKQHGSIEKTFTTSYSIVSRFNQEELDNDEGLYEDNSSQRNTKKL